MNLMKSKIQKETAKKEEKKEEKKIKPEDIRKRFDLAKENIEESKVLKQNKMYNSSLEKSYKSILNSVKAVLMLDNKEIKDEQKALNYFNKKYVKTNIFPKKFGLMINLASKLNKDLSQDDFLKLEEIDVSSSLTTAVELYSKTKEYINTKSKEFLGETKSSQENIQPKEEVILSLGKKKNILDYVVDKKEGYTLEDILVYTEEGDKLFKENSGISNILISDINSILVSRSLSPISFKTKNEILENDITLGNLQEKNISIYEKESEEEA